MTDLDHPLIRVSPTNTCGLLLCRFTWDSLFSETRCFARAFRASSSVHSVYAHPAALAYLLAGDPVWLGRGYPTVSARTTEGLFVGFGNRLAAVSSPPI